MQAHIPAPAGAQTVGNESERSVLHDAGNDSTGNDQGILTWLLHAWPASC